MVTYPYAYMTYIVSPLAGLGGGISWRPPAYSLLVLLLLLLLSFCVPRVSQLQVNESQTWCLLCLSQPDVFTHCQLLWLIVSVSLVFSVHSLCCMFRYAAAASVIVVTDANDYDDTVLLLCPSSHVEIVLQLLHAGDWSRLRLGLWVVATNITAFSFCFPQLPGRCLLYVICCKIISHSSRKHAVDLWFWVHLGLL